MPKPSIRTFVSYSHEDRDIVEPIITLLRVTRNDVFWDYQSIPLGSVWRKEIKTALKKADVIVVFWCRHAEQSSEVAKEWRAARTMGKRLLPVVLDTTKMPRSLGQFQAVDFRSIVGSHTTRHNATKARTERLHLNAKIGPLLLFAALAASAKSIWGFISRVAQGDLNDLLYYAPISVWVGGVGAVVLAIGAVLRMRRGREKARVSYEDDTKHMAELLYSGVTGIQQG